MNDGRSGHHWARETLAGCTGAVAVLPVLITVGLLAFSPLGVAAAQVAVLAAFVTASIGSLFHALLSRTALPMSGPSSPSALALAALVAQLMVDPRLAPSTAAGLQGILALCGLAVLLSGLVQIGFAWLGLARLARVVPQPVQAGFMNSAALLLLLAQVPLLLDVPPGRMPPLAQLADVAHPAALALGVGTAVVIWLLARQRPRWPSALIGLLAGTAVHALCESAIGPAAGARIGPLPWAWPWPPVLLSLPAATGLDLLQTHAGPLLLTALALATIGALESSLNVRAIDQLLNARHDPRREMVVLGASNVLCGLLGGIPLLAARARALATLQAGGRGRVAVLAGPLALGLLYVVGGPLVAVLPLPVLAGVMLVVAVSLADRWSGRLLARWWAGDRSRDLVLSLTQVALVVGVSLWLGMPAGIAVGVVLSLAAFAVRMNRPLVHDRYLASARPSRRIYPTAVEALLRPLRDGITVFELDGALFFGSCDALLAEADALPRGCRYLLLDLRRVSAIDESGAVTLPQIVARLQQRGTHVGLAGVAEGTPVSQALHSFGLSHLPHWPDADRAIEAAEHRLLAEAGNAGDVREMAEMPLAGSSLLAGLDSAQVAVVAAQLQAQVLQAGEVLFAEGDRADRLYIVGKGSVSILSRPDRHGRTQRYLSLSPGMTLGETAMLDGGGRTAAAVADAPSVVYALTLEGLDGIGAARPDVAIRLHRNLALHLSQRLRGAAGAWRSSSG